MRLISRSLPVIGLAALVSACTPPAPDHRPFRVRIADDVAHRYGAENFEEVKIHDATGNPGSQCVIVKQRIFGLPAYFRSLYSLGESLNGVSQLNVVAGNDIVTNLVVGVRCPFGADDYKPFPEYEALKPRPKTA